MLKPSVGLVIATLLLFSPHLAAAGHATGTVGTVQSEYAANVFYFTVAGTYAGQPACSLGRFAVSTDQSGGRAVMATVLAAKLAGATLTVTGVGDQAPPPANPCSVHGDAETVWFVTE